MLDRQEIEIEIARLEYGESSYPAYAKLADLYAIRDQMDRAGAQTQVSFGLMHSAAPTPELPADSGSDFLRAAAGKEPEHVWAIMDDLMDTLRVVNPRVYSGIINRLRAL